MYPFDSIESRIEKLNEKIKKIERQIPGENYGIYFSQATINNYIKLVIKYQTKKNRPFFPSKEEDFLKYINKVNSNFDYNLLKYKSTSDLTLICKFIGNLGMSGYSYLENLDSVFILNKPTLMFYGFEHLAAYFRNLYFNFTDENKDYNQIKRKLHRHGIDSFEFKNLQINIPLEKILEKKIKLKLEGLCPSFFLVYQDDNYSSVIDLFINESEISLMELLRNFFYIVNENIPDLIRAKFEEEFSNDWPKVRLNSTLLTLYLLSFIFSHISRYKLNVWSSIFENRFSNLSLYINYILKYGKIIFIKLLFNRIFYNEMNIGGIIHHSIIDR